MMEFPKITTHKDFKWSELHKKFVKIIVQEPSDSDLQEGQFRTQILFVTDKFHVYVLGEF